jgi:hypothetical protein
VAVVRSCEIHKRDDDNVYDYLQSCGLAEEAVLKKPCAMYVSDTK